MTDKTQTLDLALDELLRRTGLALKEPGTPSEMLEKLSEEAEEIAAPLKAEISRLHKRALDPLLDREDLDAAKKAADDLEHDAQRLAALKDILADHMRRLRDDSRHAAHRARYDATIKQRDEAVRLLRDLLKLLRYIANINQIIMKANEAVDRMNRELPPDCAPITRPEGLVRGFPDRDGYEQPAALTAFRVTQMMIPDPDRPDGIIWPPVPSYQMNVLDQRRGYRQQEVNSIWQRR